MRPFDEFQKACPVHLCLQDGAPRRYKYFAEGKGCTLGILFEDSVNVYFEWLTEAGRPVAYGPEVRFKFWPKREFTRLMQAGVWETTHAGAVAA